MKNSKVFIKHVNNDISTQINQIMNELAPKDFTGKQVLVKPNMVGPSKPELSHTTDPRVINAIVKECLARNADVIVGDNPGGMVKNTTEVAKESGIFQASEGCFATISDHIVNRTGTKTNIKFPISKKISKVDYVINVPKFKTHITTINSGAIKNTFGYIPGIKKSLLHGETADLIEFGDLVCDIFEQRRPDLNIMDAVSILEYNGPSFGGIKRELNKIIASTDALALDCVMTRMMGLDINEICILYAASKRKLGNHLENKIEIIGDFKVIDNFKLPSTYKNNESSINKIKTELYPMFDNRQNIKPLYDSEKCVMCGECINNCPTNALSLTPEYQINEKCISCFCCVELCHYGALYIPDCETTRNY